MKINAKVGDKLTLMTIEQGRYPPHPAFIEITKKGTYYLTGIRRLWDNNLNDWHTYNTERRLDMREYKIVARCFDKKTLDTCYKYSRAESDYKQTRAKQHRAIKWEEEDKFRTAKNKRQNAWDKANPAPKRPEWEEVTQ